MAISEKYAELLKTSENHVSVDMFKLKSSISDPNLAMSWKENVLWGSYTVWNYLWKSIVLIATDCSSVLSFIEVSK